MTSNRFVVEFGFFRFGSRVQLTTFRIRPLTRPSKIWLAVENHRPFVGGRLARIFGAVGNGYEVEEADGGMAWHEKDIGMLGDWRPLVVLSK
ncbi:hypothetical protein N7505_001267 [Penicillium chrysogenum]|uniref:Uncharacterized protein n=1 Tax=Penicillium chrysogenum TaxID=5076 RepID=A0ABQ8WW70_PENCH|nr:hypothetical protein N7505_001267 [Penicillium chrysogenum]